jgi:hypothetical protein
MPIIEITNDTADAIFRDMLVQDYSGLKSEKIRLESAESLADFQKQDLIATRRYLVGMEIRLEYYLTQDELDRVVNG